jgi:hypothetical protein
MGFSRSIADFAARWWRPHPSTDPRPDGARLAKLLFELPAPAPSDESSELFFVADPASMKALREAGAIRKGPDGRDHAFAPGRSIPVFGYASDASMDDRHWGLELRRVSPQRVADQERHALREQDAESEEAGAAPPKPSHRGARRL